jgi:hypothetical protein
MTILFSSSLTGFIYFSCFSTILDKSVIVFSAGRSVVSVSVTTNCSSYIFSNFWLAIDVLSAIKLCTFNLVIVFNHCVSSGALSILSKLLYKSKKLASILKWTLYNSSKISNTYGDSWLL